MIKFPSSCRSPLWAASSHDRSCLNPYPAVKVDQNRPGQPLRINTVSLISYCFLVQLLFTSTSMRASVSASNETDNHRRLGASTFKFSDEDLPVSATCDYEEHEINELYDKVKDDLIGLGYSVKEGNFEINELKVAINNPGNPYLIYTFEDDNPVNLPFEFKLKPSSAVLFLGCTPSAVKYFSWQSYAFDHQKRFVFASLGDAINNLVINTTQSGTSWTGSELEDPLGKLTAVVTTADATTFSTINTALDEAGAPTGITNLDHVPHERVDLFNDKTLTFIMLVRPVIWTDEGEKEKYFSPQVRRVFMIDPPPEQSFDPIPEPPDRPQGTGDFEIEQPGVLEDLAKLHNNIAQTMESSFDYTLMSNTTFDHFPIYGDECLETLQYCIGDSRDAEYFIYGQKESFKKKDLYVFVGTNSVNTGKVSYSSIGIYQKNALRPIVATTIAVDNFMMEGSASAFGIDNDKLLAYVLARNCKRVPEFLRENCFTVGFDEETELPARKSWSIFYRTYLDITTKTQPLKEELYWPQILKFRLP